MNEEFSYKKVPADVIKHINIGFNNAYDVNVEYQGSEYSIRGDFKNDGVQIRRFYDTKNKYVYYFYYGSCVGEFTSVVANVMSGKSDLEEKDNEDFFGPESGLTRQNKNMYLAEKQLAKGHEEEDKKANKIIRVGHSLGGYKAMVATLTSAALDRDFDSKKNEVILINALGMSGTSVNYFKDKLGEEKFGAITSRVVNVNCVEDYVSPMNKNVFGETFYFAVKNKSNLRLHDKHQAYNLDLENQVSFNRNYLFWQHFYESVRQSQSLLGQENYYQILHSLFMLIDKIAGNHQNKKITKDVYGNEFKIQPFKVAVSLAILAKSYVSAYFHSMSVGRQVSFGLGVVASVGAVVLTCAKVLAIGFLLTFPPAALIASAVTLGCIGLGAMISSFVKMNWDEPVDENKSEVNKVNGPEINEPKPEKDVEQSQGNEQPKEILTPNENVNKTSDTFVQQRLKKANIGENQNENNKILFRVATKQSQETL